MSFEIKKGVLKKCIPEPGQTEVCIPDGIHIIGAKAFDFETCESLERLFLPDGLTELKQYAFNCWNIKHIRVPDSLLTIGKNSFPAGVKTVEYQKGTAPFIIDHDSYEVTEIISYLLGASEKAFSELRAGSRLELAMICLTAPALFDEQPFSEALQYAKAQKKKLLDIIVEQQAVNALAGAVSKGLLNQENSAAYLKKAEKLGNVELTALILNCSKPTDVPKKEIFTVASDSVTVTDAKKLWGIEKENDSYVLKSYKGEDAAVTPPSCIGKLPVRKLDATFNCWVNSKQTYARQHWIKENMKTVVIPEGVWEIGENTFAVNEALSTVVLPESVIKIGNCAFRNCPSLHELYIPSSAELGDRVFEGCKDLTLRGAAGSPAERYAKENGMQFVVE